MKHRSTLRPFLLLALASPAVAAQSAPDNTPPALAPPPATATAPAAAPPAAAPPTAAPPAAEPPAPPATPVATPVATPTPPPPTPASPRPAPLAPFAEPSNTTPPLPDVPVPSFASSPPTPTLSLWLGFRNQIVPSDGLDPFSENDIVPAFELSAGVGVYDFSSGQLAIAANADFGGSSASLRGQPTDLGVMRFGAGPELRFPLLDRLYVFGRLAPQALQVSTELNDTSSAMKFADEQWTFALDAALGASFRFAAADPGGLQHPIAFFVRAEAGYLWSPAIDLKLPPTGDAPVRTAPLDLNELALSGLSFGAAIGVGY